MATASRGPAGGESSSGRLAEVHSRQTLMLRRLTQQRGQLDSNGESMDALQGRVQRRLQEVRQDSEDARRAQSDEAHARTQAHQFQHLSAQWQEQWATSVQQVRSRSRAGLSLCLFPCSQAACLPVRLSN
jgi:ABC-type nickel/cobalt efflux system permease component RcnA